MIVYSAKRSPIEHKLLLKRWYRKRTFDRNARLSLDMERLRKKWWHFKTRWEM